MEVRKYGVLTLVLVIFGALLLQGCGDGSTKLHKSLMNVALTHQDPTERIEALEALSDLTLTNSSFDAFVKAMRNDEDEAVRDTAAHLLDVTAENSEKWRTRCARAVSKAARDGKVDAKYRDALWKAENPKKAELVIAEIEKRANAAVVSLKQRLETAEAKRKSVADEYSYGSPRPARQLRKKRADLIEKIASELSKEDQKRPYSKRKYNNYTVGLAAEKDPRVVALDKQIGGMSQEAAKAKEECKALRKQIENARTEARRVSDEFFGKGLENLHREWFGK